MINEQLLEENLSPSDNDDQKMKKILEKYFAYPYDINKRNNGEQLNINFVEFEPYQNSLNEIERKFSRSSALKYVNAYENIKEARIYSRDYKPKYIDKWTFFPYFFIFLIGFIIAAIFGSIAIKIIFYILALGVYIFLSIMLGLFSIQQLNADNIQKLNRILNAKPMIQLCIKKNFEKQCLVEVKYHSYADITGINCIQREKLSLNAFPSFEINFDPINLNNTLFLDFPLKYIYFVDSSREYFKFLINQFNKYCFLELKDERTYYSHMYMKFVLHTEDGKTFNRTNSFFFTTFTTMNIILYRIILIFSNVTLTTPILYLIFKCCMKRRIIDIKKVISLKHDLEQYLNLDSLFFKIISNVQLQRTKHEPISDKDTIMEEFINECVEMTEKVKNITFMEKEQEGYLLPFNSYGWFLSRESWDIEKFEKYYGKKAEKILKRKKKDIFKIDNRLIVNELESMEDKNEDDEDDSNLISGEEYNSNKKPLRKVVYKESILVLTFNISKSSVSCQYTIKLPNGMNKTGKFNMKCKINGFEELEEKCNNDWTKSEIYIPGCSDVVTIVRKRRAIKIEYGGDSIVQTDTQLNTDIHSGSGCWLDNNEWDDKVEKRFVKDCSKNSPNNRFKIQYA